MIALLLDIYVLILWLIFFKFKLLKFDLKAQIGSGVLGVLFVFGILIAVNFLHPQTFDANVFQRVVQIAPRISQPGRVIEVPVVPNTPVKAGDVLFRIDPRPYQLEIDRLTAAVAEAEQNVPQLKAAWDAATDTVARSEASLKQADAHLVREKELRERNVNTAEDLEIAQKDRDLASATLLENKALAEKARLAFESQTVGGVNVQVAQLQAQLEEARINLADSTVTASTSGFVTNLELRPGFVVTPGVSVVTLVPDPEGIVVATFPQEFLMNVAVGDEAEIALDLYPGRTLKGKVDAIIWATGQGQLSPSGQLPNITEAAPRSRFGVKILVSEADQKAYRLPAGAGGSVAIYTQHGKSWQIVRRVMLRWYTWLNFLKISM